MIRSNNLIVFQVSLTSILLSLLLACQPEPDHEIQAQINSVDQLDRFMRDELDEQDLVGLAAARITRDQVTWSGYYGFAHLDYNRPVDAQTQFMIASVSKTITGVALMTLYDAGEFDLEDSINDYLPIPIINPNRPDVPITFTMLLNHTSSIIDEGYNELDGLYTYGSDSLIELSDFLTDYLTPEGQYYDGELNFSEFEPGAHFEYSNIGSALIGYLTEHISGEPFDQYCQRAIFEPLAMNDTTWRLNAIDQTRLAMPYDDEDQPYGHYSFPDYPNGQLFTTIPDLSRFLLMFMGEGSLGDVQILSRDTATLMRRLSAPNITSDFGLHWFYTEYNGVRYLGHDGSEQGVNTMMFYDPDRLVGALLFTNSDQADLEVFFEAIMSLELN